MVLEHLARLGLRANWQKSKLISFISVEMNCKELNCHNESMSFRKLCSLSAELIEFFQVQNSGPSQIFPQAPGAYGILSRGNAQDGHGAAAHITWSSHWGDVAHSVLGWTFLFYGQEFPRTSVHTCCCYNRRIQDRLGHRVQRVWLYYQVPERCAEVKFSETVPHPLLGSLGGSYRPYREIYLSLYSQSSSVPSLWRRPSWLCSPRSRGWETYKPAQLTKRVWSLGWQTLTWSWDADPAMFLRFLLPLSGIKWWTCKRSLQIMDTQPCLSLKIKGAPFLVNVLMNI